MELTDSYADVNGIRLHYVSVGKGKLILFVHGFPEFWYGWNNQLTEFGRDYQAVAPDLRGYNLSSKPAPVDQYQADYIVEDLYALVRFLGHHSFCLVGHDWGGVIAWILASRYPRSVEKLIIINAPHPAVFARELRENPAQQQASQYMMMFRNPQAEQFLSANNYAALVESVLGEGLKQGYFKEEDRNRYVEAWSQPGALTGGLNYYRAAALGPSLRDTPQEEDKLLRGQIDVPTLVIWGEKDRYLLTGNLQGLDQFVSKLTVRRIPDASHWVVHEKPTLVNSYIRDFIEGTQETT
jgi:pimeloyl-ACP methyl ester carboxylesterase